MRISILKPGLLMAFAISIFTASAQQEDLKRLSEKMADRRMSYKASYNMYDAYSGGRLLESQQISLSMWDAMINIKTKLFHVIKNKEHYLYADLSRKAIMVNKVNNYNDGMKQAEKIRALVDFDSLFASSPAGKLVGEKGDERTYRQPYGNDSRFAYADITLNTRTHAPVKIVMYYSNTLSELLGKNNDMASGKKPRIEMVFHSFEYTTKANPSGFSISGYLKKVSGKFSTLPAYSNYELIDNTLIK